MTALEICPADATAVPPCHTETFVSRALCQ